MGVDRAGDLPYEGEHGDRRQQSRNDADGEQPSVADREDQRRGEERPGDRRGSSPSPSRSRTRGRVGSGPLNRQGGCRGGCLSAARFHDTARRDRDERPCEREADARAPTPSRHTRPRSASVGRHRAGRRRPRPPLSTPKGQRPRLPRSRRGPRRAHPTIAKSPAALRSPFRGRCRTASWRARCRPRSGCARSI